MEARSASGHNTGGPARRRLSPVAVLWNRGIVWKTSAMLVLASQSEIRKSLLRQAGLAFDVRAANVNERRIEAGLRERGASPAEVSLALAEAKAIAVGESFSIGADQVLALGPDILHKVDSIGAARDRLDALRGRTHQLHAAVALARRGELIWSTVVTCSLTMRSFSNAERDRILALDGESVRASVGAYRFEGPSVQLFEAIEGDYFSILGLPLLPLLAALRTHAPEVFG